MRSTTMILPALLMATLPVLGAPCDPAPSPLSDAVVNLPLVGQSVPLLGMSQPPDDAAAQQIGTDAVLSAGRVPVQNLLRYLQAATGKPVLFVSIERHASKSLDENATIQVLETIRPLTVPIVQAILMSNHIHVREVVLVDGSEVLHVTEQRDDSLRPLERVEPVPEEKAAAERPVLLETDAEWNLAPDEIGTIVVQIENARISDLVRLVDRLVDDRNLEILPIGGKKGHYLALRGRATSIAAARDLIRALDRDALWPASSDSGDATPTKGNAQGESEETQQKENKG